MTAQNETGSGAGGNPGNKTGRERIFNVPPAVLVPVALMFAVHLLRQGLGFATDMEVILAGGFIPVRFESGGEALPGGEVARFTSWLTHMFLHGDWEHLAFNSVWFLIFGTAIASRIGAVRFLAYAALTGVAGAALFYGLHAHELRVVIGASGAVAGLSGGTVRLMFPAMDSGGLHRLREAPGEVVLPPLRASLSDPRILVTTLVVILMNALAAFQLGIAQKGAGIAWEAHIGGYLAGLFLLGAFERRNADSNQNPTPPLAE